ncbi:helix-turn-helix domain-containing protein [Acidithiobacillus caldus]
MNYNQLAAHLGVSVQTLYNWQSTGKPMPPSYQVGRLRRFHREAVDIWLALQSSPGVPPPAQGCSADSASPTKRRGRPRKQEKIQKSSP